MTGRPAAIAGGLRALALVLALAWSPPARAWGDKGHEMSGRVAARALPPEMPAFFRAADVELGYLCAEPDRWRSEAREPALRGATDRDHAFKLEDARLPLPAHRYDFFVQSVGKPRPGGPPGALLAYKDLGFAPYAIAEHGERLTNGFLWWRNARQGSPAERRVKRQIEQNIIYVAGVLGHFVTDTAQPLHTTVSTNGWVTWLPNPRHFVGQSIHQRFETFYVNAAIEEEDFAPLVGAVRERGPWLEAALDHIRAAHQHVEALYALDQAHPFGAGNEPPEAKRFTCERLADGARALRDFWYTAWVRSGPLAAEAAAQRNPNRASYGPSKGSRRTSR
jgi:hypothetical protein